jgi:hypothetical protein
MAFSARFFCRTAYIPTPRRTRTKIALPTAIPAIKPVLMEVRLSESEEKYNFIREERERERKEREMRDESICRYDLNNLEKRKEMV